MNITLEDLENIDPSLYHGLKAILDEPNSENLYLTYSYERTHLGSIITKELMPDGANIFINESNKKDYVKAVCQDIMVNSIKNQL